MKITNIIEGFRGSVDLSDVPVGRNYRLRKKKSCTNRLILRVSIDNRISFHNHFIFFKVNCSGHL